MRCGEAVRFGRWMVAGALLLAAQLAHGHDFWIEAEPYSQDAAGPVAVSLLVGEHFKGETLPYIDSWIDRFELHDGMGMRPIEGVMGDDPAGSVQARTGGASWVAYQSTDDFVELPPAKFDDYLAMEGMEYIRPLRERRGQADAPGREYYVRCVKALLWTPGEDGVAVDAPLGLTLEVVPLANPYVMKVDDVLEVRLLHEGRPVPGLLVKAFTREAPEREALQRTDDDGRARLALDRAGTWIVKTVHMVAIEGDPYGDWRSYWASLTFELR